MRVDLTKKIQSSFLSCEKDFEKIIKTLFVDNRQYSDILKRLLVINKADCIDNLDSEVYKEAVEKASVKWLMENDYLKLTPKDKKFEHDVMKSQIYISFNDFITSGNPQFRDNIIEITIFCPFDHWELGDYRLRPFKIMGYIDGLLQDIRLTGMGELELIGCKRIVLDENYGGYTMIYNTVHSVEDKIPDEDR